MTGIQQSQPRLRWRRAAGLVLVLASAMVFAVNTAREHRASPGGAAGTAARAPRAAPAAPAPPHGGAPDAGRPSDNSLVARLYAERRSNVMVEVAAPVERLLRDDTQGSRHQRFVVRVGPGLTVLVAHNISLAPRVPLQRGSNVRIRGEYEWNPQGGVLHWTHRDPRRGHQDGWIEFDGRRYQ